MHANCNNFHFHRPRIRAKPIRPLSRPLTPFNAYYRNVLLLARAPPPLVALNLRPLAVSPPMHRCVDAIRLRFRCAVAAAKLLAGTFCSR